MKAQATAPKRKAAAPKVTRKLARKPAVAPQSPHVAPEKATAKTKATRGKKTPTAATKADGPRATSKTAQLIEMLKRAGGATLEEVMARFGWQVHTTRAMMSAGGSLTKKHGITVISERVGDARTYRIAR
jgi:hypothetical protein